MSAATSVADHDFARAARRWDDLAAIGLLIVLISTIYVARLGTQPIVGEESRWGTGAREMLATGDWIVPRQQGHVFPERPPMTMWAMAAAGWLRGAVDPIAIRLPSVLAVLLTSLLIYFYARTLASQFAALVAAIVYATMGQVLQIGRLGESEALFALFVSASLLLWHLGYSRSWPTLATWSTGFACAALAALVKGPQAPVYFVAITAVYLAVRRDWRFLFCWQYAAAATVFATIIAAWQIPFYLATDWPTVKATWSGLAADRFQLQRPREACRHVPARNIRLPAALVAAARRAREARNSRTALRTIARSRRFSTSRCSSPIRPSGWPLAPRSILHAALPAHRRAHRAHHRALLDGPDRPIPAPRLAPVSAALRHAHRHRRRGDRRHRDHRGRQAERRCTNRDGSASYSPASRLASSFDALEVLSQCRADSCR